MQQYDFLDFGTKFGGSMDYALKRLSATRGLGIEIDEQRVTKAKELGYDCLQGDITNLQYPAKSVKFVMMFDILEHLPDITHVKKTIDIASNIATDFICIRGPFFDADNYLKSLGLKLFWSDWSNHPCHLTTTQLKEVLHELNLNIYHFDFIKKITKSTHNAIHPLSSPQNQAEYDIKKHPIKKGLFKFNRDIYWCFICYIKLRDFDNWNNVIKSHL